MKLRKPPATLAAPTATVTMSQLSAAKRVYQRSTTSGGGQSKGQGSIPVTFSAVSVAGTIHARCSSGGGTRGDLQAEFAAATIGSTGAQTVSLSGIDARLGWFQLDILDSSGTWQNGTVLVGMGRVIAISGQSLAVRMFNTAGVDTTNTNTSLSVTIDPNCSVYGQGDGNPSSPTWAAPADGSYTTTYNSCFASEFLRLQVAAAGVNCAQVGQAVGSTSITDWIPSGTFNANLRSTLAVAGGFEAFIWYQGHADSQAGMSGATYQSNLTTLFGDMTAHNGVRGSSYEIYLGTIPNIITGTTWGTPAQITVIRNASSAWAAANGGVYVGAVDVAEVTDGIHENNIGARTLGRHFYRASRPALGLSHDDAGPTISSISRATGSANVVLTMSLPSGATALASVGAPLSRFVVASKGDLTPRPISSLSLGTNTITLTLTQTPGDNAPLDVWFGYPPDPVADGGADMILDNNASDSDGLTAGRTLAASLAAVAVAAPVTNLGPTLTASTSPAATFAASSESAFGQCLTGGYGSAAAVLADDVMPWASTFTVECRFKISSIPGNAKVMWGANGLLWLGVASTTGYLTNSAIADGTTNVCDANWHHVAFVCNGSSGMKIYLDGVVHVSSGSRYTPSSSSTGHFDIGTFIDSATFQWPGSINEVAVWTTAKYTANFTPPTAPYTGAETGLYALYHLDGNFTAG